MQPIRIYNRFLDLKAEIDTYQSLQFGRNYHAVADFELHINRYMHKADEIQKGDIIGLAENKAGIILSKEIALDQSGKESENFKLTGYTLDGLIKRRITVPPSDTAYDRKSGDAETVMKHYVERHFVNPADPERKMPYVEIAENRNRGPHIDYESRFKNVADELENISIQSGLGWGVFADFKNKRLVFDVIERRDLTQDNPYGNNPVFFSPEFETIKNQDFVDSDNDLKTVGYVGGQGEGTDRKVVTIGDDNGWDRIETFVDARDVGNNDEEELTDEEIEKKLRERGKEKMRDMQTIFTLEAEILTPVTRTAYEYTHEGYLQPAQPTGRYERKQQQITPFAYEKDFDLGDMVQVVNKSWGLTMTAPITAFKEIHEPGGFRLEATFGRDRPTLISKIQDKFDELEGIEKQELPAQVAVETRNYIDEGLTQEEQERIEQAKQNLAEAKGFTRDYAEKKVIKSNTAPSDTDVLWFDTSKTPNIIKAHDGTEWRKATPTEAGELVYSDGTPVENLKPNEAGSDVTGNNTANDTANVGGTNAGTVRDNASAGKSAKDIVDANKSTWDKATVFNADGTLNVEYLEGQLTDEAIESASKWNNQGTYIDSTGVYTGTVLTHQLAAGTALIDEALIKEITSNKIAANTITNTELSDTLTFEADQINFDGHVFGTNATFAGELQAATGTFSGDIDTPMLTIGDGDIGGYEEFGVRLQTAQWQPDDNEPFVPTGHIYFNTLNNGLEIYQEADDGSDSAMDYFYVHADYLELLSDNITIGNSVSAAEFDKHGNLMPSVSATANSYWNIKNVDGQTIFRAYWGSDGERVEVNRRDFEVTSGRVINQATHDTTTSSNANMYVASNGYYARSTSARKYKKHIEPANVDYTKILNLNPKSWYDKAEIEANGGSTEGLQRYYGAIADEFEEIGLPEYAVYENGEIENFNDRAWTLLIPNINDLKSRVEKLEAKLNETGCQ